MNSFKKVSKNHENQLQLDKCNWILKQNVTIEQILILQDHWFTSRWQFIQFASYRISLWKPFKVSLNLKSSVPMFSWILMWGVFLHGFSWAIEWLGVILKILSKNIQNFFLKTWNYKNWHSKIPALLKFFIFPPLKFSFYAKYTQPHYKYCHLVTFLCSL